MTLYRSTVIELLFHRSFSPAVILRIFATRVKFAARRTICQTGDFPFDRDQVAALVGVELRYTVNQCLGIRVRRVHKDRLSIALFVALSVHILLTGLRQTGILQN